MGQMSHQYAAGFFDGEGCVNITKVGRLDQVALRVSIVNTDPGVLAMLHEKYGGHLTAPHQKKPNWKPFRALVFTGRGAAKFLRLIQPYVILKRAQVRLGLEFLAFMESPGRCHSIPHLGKDGRVRTTQQRTLATICEETEFKNRMHLLNRKGVA